MNTIEAMRHLCNIAELLIDEDVEAQQIISDLLDAYDALIPLLNLWPADMNWFAIDGNGRAYWYEDEPTIEMRWCEWDGEMAEEAGQYVLAPGVDWRLCIWQRPEAK